MPMDHKEYEELLNKLNNPELEHNQRVDILGLLRNDYNAVHEDFTTLSTEKEKLESENKDLIIANGKMFRDMGIPGEEQEEEPEAPKRLSDLIQNANDQYM